MTSLLSSLWHSADSAGRRSSMDDRRASHDGAAKEAEMRAAVAPPKPAVQPAVTSTGGTKHNIWEGVFNPGRNMNLAKAPATYYDQPGDSKATTWDHVLKADNVKRLTFASLDKNSDGFIDAAELRTELSGSSADIDAMIKQADKNGDGKIDFAEFNDLFRNSPSA